MLLGSIVSVTRPSTVRVGAAPRGSILVARILGVPVYLSASWLLILVFITVSFADLFRAQVVGATGATPYAMAAAFAVLSLLCVLLHELGHVVAALGLGLRVRRVYLFLLGGVSEIAPEPATARQELVVSAAGPLVSGAVAGLAWLAALTTSAHSGADVELQLLVWSNLVIAVFNALPGLPLDGGRVLRALVWGATRSRLTGTVAGAWGGRLMAVLVVVAVVLMPRSGWQFGASGFTVLVALFLWMGASQSLLTARLGERVPELAVTTLLRHAVWLAATTPLAQALAELRYRGARAIVIVDSVDRPIAIVDEARVNAVAANNQAWTSIGELATALSLDHALPITLTGGDLLRACQRHPASEYLVVDTDGRPMGVLAAADIRGALTSAGR